MTVARYLCLLLPAAALLGVAGADRTRTGRAGAFLAFLAAATGIAALHEVSTAAGWYAFAPVDGAYRGLPVDLWLGWAALWGPVPVLLRRMLPLPVAVGALLWIDVVAMPALDPLVVLGPHWLAGEALGLVAVALPAQLLGRWTADRRHLIPRVLMQMALYAAVLLWLVPSIAFTWEDAAGWDRLLRLPGPALFLLAQVALLISVPALAAVREFATRGGGTPFPWDPPERLVTTGPYAYLANPMQVSSVLLLLLLAAATRSGALAGAVLVAVAFAGAVAAPHERFDLDSRHGERWREYRRNVRDWWPRRRPHLSTGARLWLDDDCGPCAGVRDALLAGRPQNLAIRSAASHPETLWRARYEADDGHIATGVGAVARGMEHTGPLWAYTSWVVMLPGVSPLAQLVTDALIAPPHAALRQNDRP